MFKNEQLKRCHVIEVSELAKTGAMIKTGKVGEVSFGWTRGVLNSLFRGLDGQYKRVVVPKRFRHGPTNVSHESLMAGHLGTKETTDRIWQQFYWPSICADIRRFCASCDQCQRVTPQSKVGKVPLSKIPLIDVPFQRVAVDLIGPISPLLKSWKWYILTVIGFATRYREAVALESIEAESVIEAVGSVVSTGHSQGSFD